MPSFEDMQRKYTSVGTIGQQLKIMADEVMQETMDNDPQTKQAYLYDYYHDDQVELEYGYNPALSETKIPIKVKFIVKSYKTFAKDDVDYHIMFEPDAWNSMNFKPNWFETNYQKLGIHFPVGLYCDIPDDRGVYHKWLVVYEEPANQFPKFGILKCNHRFMWIEKDGTKKVKHKVWGINATQNSYTSGVWRDYRFQSYDDQGKFFLPWNPISSTLRHNTRIIISMLQKNPWAYIITKVNDTATKGMVEVTVKQDKFEPEHDYVQLDPSAPDYGDMYADLLEDTVTATEKDEVKGVNLHGYQLSIQAKNNLVKLNSVKILEAHITDGNDKDITSKCNDMECKWEIKLDNDETGILSTPLLSFDTDYMIKNKFKCKFKFLGDEKYLSQNLTVKCTVGKLESNIILDITAL